MPSKGRGPFGPRPNRSWTTIGMGAPSNARTKAKAKAKTNRVLVRWAQKHHAVVHMNIKRVVLTLGVAGLVAVVGGGFAFYSVTFKGNLKPNETPLPDGTRPIIDGFVNLFAVPLTTPGKVALVDCGNDPEAKAIKAALATGKAEVAAIFITHAHSDHIAGCTAFPGVPVYALQSEVDGVEGRVGFNGPVTGFSGPKDLGVRVSNPLKDGDDVDVDGVVFHVYATPGHTVGSAVYRARQTVFFGDAAGAKEPHRLVGPVGLFSDNEAQGRTSLRAIGADLAQHPEVTTFAFGHTGAIPADAAGLQSL